jgi:hypothetical protein
VHVVTPSSETVKPRLQFVLSFRYRFSVALFSVSTFVSSQRCILYFVPLLSVTFFSFLSFFISVVHILFAMEGQTKSFAINWNAPSVQSVSVIFSCMQYLLTRLYSRCVLNLFFHLHGLICGARLLIIRSFVWSLEHCHKNANRLYNSRNSSDFGMVHNDYVYLAMGKSKKWKDYDESMACAYIQPVTSETFRTYQWKLLWSYEVSLMSVLKRFLVGCSISCWRRTKCNTGFCILSGL